MRAISRWSSMLLVAAVAAALLAVVVALVAGGGAPRPAIEGLPSAGPATEWMLVFSRLIGFLAAALAAGLLLTLTVLLPDRRSTGSWHTRTIAVAAAVAAIAAVVQLVCTMAVVLGGALTAAAVAPFILELTLGRTLAAQILLAVLIAVTATQAGSKRVAVLLLPPALLLAVLPGLGGHAGSGADHVLTVGVLLIHLLAVAVWVGGLSGLAGVAFFARPELRGAILRFSPLALWCALAVGASGVISGMLRIDRFDALFSTGYGNLVLVKAVAFAGLVLAGFLHRRNLLAYRLGEAGNVAFRVFLRLASAELVLMAATYGVAVGLARTPPPAGSSLAPVSAAQRLLGYDLPDAPSAGNLFGLQLDLFGLVFAATAASLYLLGVRVLAGRGDAWPLRRTVVFLAGVLVVLLVTATGIGRYASAMFSVHMVQHMGLNLVAPLLLVLGAPVTLALRALPVTGRRTLLSLLKSRTAGVVSHPLLVAGIFIASLYLLYFTGLFELAMRSHWGHIAMQLHFLVSGFLLFWLLLGIDPDPRRPGQGVRILLLVGVMLTHTVFAMVLVFGRTVIAGSYYRELHLPWSVSLLDDQALGGAITWVPGEFLIVGVLGALIIQWFARQERVQRARELAWSASNAD